MVRNNMAMVFFMGSGYSVRLPNRKTHVTTEKTGGTSQKHARHKFELLFAYRWSGSVSYMTTGEYGGYKFLMLVVVRCRRLLLMAGAEKQGGYQNGH